MVDLDVSYVICFLLKAKGHIASYAAGVVDVIDEDFKADVLINENVLNGEHSIKRVKVSYTRHAAEGQASLAAVLDGDGLVISNKVTVLKENKVFRHVANFFLRVDQEEVKGFVH